jgi:hypothetical protein
MHKHGNIPAWQNDVGTTGQILPSQRKSKSKPVQQGADSLLRSGVPPFDATHIPASPFCGQPVHTLVRNSSGGRKPGSADQNGRQQVDFISEWPESLV